MAKHFGDLLAGGSKSVLTRRPYFNIPGLSEEDDSYGYGQFKPVTPDEIARQRKLLQSGFRGPYYDQSESIPTPIPGEPREGIAGFLGAIARGDVGPGISPDMASGMIGEAVRAGGDTPSDYNPTDRGDLEVAYRPTTGGEGGEEGGYYVRPRKGSALWNRMDRDRIRQENAP